MCYYDIDIFICKIIEEIKVGENKKRIYPILF